MNGTRRHPVIDGLCQALAIAAGWAMLGLAFLVSLDTILRKFFGFSFQGADEIGGYVLAVTSAAGFSHALISKAHIRIDIVSVHFSTPARALLDTLAFALLNVFVWLMVWRAAAVTWQSYSIGAHAPTPLQTPLVVPQAVWTAGLLLFGILTLSRLATGIAGLASRRWNDVTAELGPATLEEEISYELADAEARSRSRDQGRDHGVR